MVKRKIAAALLAVAAGCGRQALMEDIPPPTGWAQRITADRMEKDREFRDGAASPLLPEDRAGFRGLDYWPIQPGYRLVGPMERHRSPERFTILSTSGKPRPCEKYGRVAFALFDKTYGLEVYRLLDVEAEPGRESLFLPFTDETTGRETYPAGRYVDLEGPYGGPYVLDFNRAYNPMCAYGDPERYACPVTPPENRLPLRVEAGERGYRRRERARS